MLKKMELFLKKKDIRYGSKIQESKGLSGTSAWPMAQKNIVRVPLYGAFR